MTEKKSLEVLNSWLRVAYQNVDGTDEASAELYEALQTVFALITRQQAENEKLVGNIDKLKAEIERLNAENMLTISERNAFRTSFYDVLKQLKTTKSEAVKECIEKVKEKASKTEYGCSGVLVKTDYTITEKELDNIRRS